MDLAGIGLVLTGSAAVIGSLAAAYMTIRNSNRIRDIDHAVNGRPKGAQTMQSQVADLHQDLSLPGEAHHPLALPPAMGDAAIKEMLRLLVADMWERRDTAQAATNPVRPSISQADRNHLSADIETEERSHREH